MRFKIVLVLISSLKNHCRQAAVGLCRLILRWRASPYQARPDSVALVLAPHPDDEVFGCGGLILTRRKAGLPVQVLYLTDGGASHPNHPTLSPKKLKQRRVQEAREALQRLGVDPTQAFFLDAPDGALDKLHRAEQAALIDQILTVLQTVKPDEVFLPYRRDGSSEHEAAFRIFHTAWVQSTPRARLWEFPIWSWWSPRLLLRLVLTRARVFRCDFSGYEGAKADAIGAYRSQVEPVAPWPQPVLPSGFAEAFRGSEEFFFEID